MADRRGDQFLRHQIPINWLVIRLKPTRLSGHLKIRAFGFLSGLLGALGLSSLSAAEQPIRIGASMSITGKAYSVQGAMVARDTSCARSM